MKFIKHTLTICTLVILFTTNNTLNASNNPDNWKSTILTYLTDVDKLDKANLPDKVLVDFILNEQGQIMILSTSYPSMDGWLKQRLNYKTINHPELQMLEKYTLPILFEQ